MITGIIMASGFSRRMGENKLIKEFKGKKLIEYVIEACLESKLDKIILVYREEDVRRIGLNYGLMLVENRKADLGQSQSIIYGVKNSQEGAYMFFPGDQPFINSQLIDFLIESYRENPNKIIIPFYDKRRYTPTIFPNIFREDLLKLEGDQGGRQIIRKNPDKLREVNIRDDRLLVDLDSIEDFNYWDNTIL